MIFVVYDDDIPLTGSDIAGIVKVECEDLVCDQRHAKILSWD